MFKKTIVSLVFSAIVFTQVHAQDFQGMAVYESKTSTSDFKTRMEGNLSLIHI
jgi:hypothetical protein